MKDNVIHKMKMVWKDLNPGNDEMSDDAAEALIEVVNTYYLILRHRVNNTESRINELESHLRDCESYLNFEQSKNQDILTPRSSDLSPYCSD